MSLIRVALGPRKDEDYTGPIATLPRGLLGARGLIVSSYRMNYNAWLRICNNTFKNKRKAQLTVMCQRMSL